MAEYATEKMMVVDPFCYRQFEEYSNTLGKEYTGTILKISISDFESIVNQRFSGANQSLAHGYAPFCKHFFVSNDFTDAVVNVLPITADNEHLLRTKYVARTADEMPVLTRFFPQELLSTQLELPKAQYLDLILYSREQIRLENAAKSSSLKSNCDNDTDAVPWGIVSIKAQDIDRELPMNPITQMRNALGRAEGGSGIPLDRSAYMESVEYWKDHAVVS
jgi:Protein of unknown function (DUF3228)